MAEVKFDKVMNVLYEAKADGRITDDDILSFMSRLVNEFSSSSKTTEQAEENGATDEVFKIKRLLEFMGVPKHFSGYLYLCDAIAFYRKAGMAKSGTIYDFIGVKYNTSPRSIERSICHAIEVACSKCSYDNLVLLFGKSVSDKPTNAEVIATLAERVDTFHFPLPKNDSFNEFDLFIKSLEKDYSNMDILDMVRVTCSGENQNPTEGILVGAEDNQKLKLIRLMESFGIKKNLKGYQFLMEAIKLYKVNPNQRITQDLYPAVAETFGTSPQKVERGIRHAVQKAAERCSEDVLYSIFGNSIQVGEIPSNSEAIVSLAEKLDYMD